MRNRSTEGLGSTRQAPLGRPTGPLNLTQPPAPAFAEELRRVVATQIGPRRPGVIYDHADVLFQVVAVTADASEARRILKRRAAQFAITVIDLITGDQHVTGAVWTGSDRVLKAVAA